MKTGRCLVVIALVSIGLGLWASNIRWGDENGFHGTGFPIAGVMWDRNKTGMMIDYPDPLAFALNPLPIFICLILLFFLWKLMRVISEEIRCRGACQISNS